MKLNFKFNTNMSIKQKMFTGFGLLILIMTLIGLKLLISMQSIKNATRTVVKEQQQAVFHSMQLSTIIEQSMSGLGFYLLSKDPVHKEQYEENLKKATLILKQIRTFKAISNDAESNTLIEKIDGTFKQFQSYHEEMLRLAQHTHNNFPGMRYSAEKINPISQQVLQNMALILNAEEDRTEGKTNTQFLVLINNMRYSWTRIMNGVRAYLGFRTDIALDEIKNHRELFYKLLERVNSEYNDHLSLEQEAAMDEILKSTLLFKDRLDTFISLHGSDKWRQDAYMIRNKIGPILGRLSSQIKLLVDRQNRRIEKTSSVLIDDSENTSILIISMLVFAIISIIALGYMLLHGIIKPMSNIVDQGIQSLTSIMKSVNYDDNSLKLISHTDDSDTINNVSRTFDVMTSALKSTLEKQKNDTDDLKGKIEMIHDVVKLAARGDLTGDMMMFSGKEPIDQLANDTQQMVNDLNDLVSQVQQSGIKVTSSTTEIAATAKQQEATVSEQAASTNEIMATVTQISATSKELLRTMRSISEIADNTAESAATGQGSLSRMEEAMRHMRKSTDTIASKLAVLNDKANNISTVVTTINKVADQTNLLSLNAAIEAEKAGEYGKGFAVVATEIRRLADQTAVATWDIEQMVKEMQSSVSAGVMGMDKFSDDVSQGVDEIALISGQLGNIIDEVQTLTPRFDTVTEGMQSQSLGGEQISESMVQLNDTAHQTADSLRQSNLSIQKLKGAANNLQSAVSIFKVRKNG